ncbi:MAG: hypothetical protein NTW38_10385 [Candidatus Aminicenantes bacterium]|nr:hypothetical protein [Candidatus Aminicenantes bacterium]
MKKITLAALAILSLGLLAVAAVNVSGSWEMTMTTPRGERKSDVVFVQDGEKLTVTMNRMNRDGNMEETKSEGTVKGNVIEWKTTRQSRDGREMTITYKGTIVDDNNMKGTMEFGGGPGGPPGGMGGDRPPAPEWKAVRKAG